MCRASANTVSRGEEEDGCGSVQSGLTGQGRAIRYPGKCCAPVRRKEQENLVVLLIVYYFPTFNCNSRKKYSSEQQVSYLCEQSVVSGFTDAYIPHHQHLDTKFINQDQIMGSLSQENVYYVHANLNTLNTH